MVSNILVIVMSQMSQMKGKYMVNFKLIDSTGLKSKGVDLTGLKSKRADLTPLRKWFDKLWRFVRFMH